MSSLFKSRITALAVGTIGVVMTSFVVASATTTVRDHRDKPVVRDHREGQPDVRDHRNSAGGGVTVRDSAVKRKPADCLGSLCNVKKVCIGLTCI